jgi:prolyl 4-hydroxylase
VLSPAALAAELALPSVIEMSVVPVLASPKVRLVESFLDASEAEHIIRIGMPGMRRSMAGAREESIRTSTTAMLPQEDPVVAAITRRASELTGYPVDYIEPLQLVRYTEGQRCVL